MKKSFTQIDTINFVYNESTPSQADSYLKNLEKNEKAFLHFSDMIELMSDLDDVILEPSNSKIDQILLYAKKTRQMTT